MRILVTGHDGYIGTVMVPMLVKAGYDVVGLDSDLYAGCTFGDSMPNVPTIKKDIRDVEAADLDSFEAVLHLAGLSNDPLSNLNPELTYQINHLASVKLAALAKQVGISRYIFSSSCSNYGAAGDQFMNEESDLNPITPYGISKVRVEQDVSNLADSDFSPIYLRNATAYGVSPRLRFDLVINNLVAWALTTGRVYLKSDGTPWRPLIHIEDISRAFIAALEAPRDVVHNQAFNVGQSGENYRISELAKIVAEIVPGCVIEYAPGAGPDKRSYQVDCSKISELIPEFKPQWNVRLGVRELYEAYQKVGLQPEEFEGPKYKRIAHIEYLLSVNKLDETLRWKVEETTPI